MVQRTNLPPKTGYVQRRIWPGLMLALLLLGGVGALDYVTGWQTSVSLFCLAPICTATWMVGRRLGAVVAFAAAMLSLLISLSEQCPLRIALWNGAVWLGAYLIFCVLLDHVHL